MRRWKNQSHQVLNFLFEEACGREMVGELTLEQGASLVSLARETSETFTKTGRKIRPENESGIFSQPRGVFVTIEKYPSHELRGCIGYPLPIKPLSVAVADNAINAANEDPRFPPLEASEYGGVIFEVSVLSVPERMSVKNPDDYPKGIKVGRDGLIVRMGYASGLLLPQVPVEWGWDSKEFLSHACQKAGLPSDMWHSKSVEIEKFSAQVFCGSAPRKKVVEKKLIGSR
jgi:uncharacterized protein